MSSPRFVLLPAFAALAVLTLAGCSSSPSSSGSSPAAASGKVISTTCLTAAVVSTDVGSTYPAPKQNTGGGVVECVYADADTYANLNYEISTIKGLTLAEAKSTIQASSQGATVTTVSGLGDGAFQFTEDDADTNANHVATTTLEIVVGSQLVDVTGTVAPSGVQAVAHSILG